MRVVLPAIVVLAGVLVLWFVFFDAGEPGGENEALDEAGRSLSDPFAPALLPGRGRVDQPGGEVPSVDVGSRTPAAPVRRVVDPTEVAIEGVVVHASNQTPVAGAWVMAEPARLPLDRLPHGLRIALPGSEGERIEPDIGFEPGLSFSTDAQGRFRILYSQLGNVVDPDDRFDLFAGAPGLVAAAIGAVAPGDSPTIALESGLFLSCEVMGPDRRPVAGVRLVTVPVNDAKSVLPHLAAVRTDEFGRAELGGLARGPVYVGVASPKFLRALHGPFDPQDGQLVSLSLVGVFEATFDMETADGIAPVAVTVSHSTNGSPPDRGIQMLQLESARPDVAGAAKWSSAPVRVPCRHGQVVFEVKAESHGLWTSEPIELPPMGGAQRIAVRLPAAGAAAVLEVAFEDELGQAKPALSLSLRLDAILALEGQAVGGAVVVRIEDRLTLSSLPAGRYAITIRTPNAAPISFEAAARPLPVDAVVAVLRPPAKVRVVFRAAEPLLVPFRIYEQGRAVPAFLEREPGAAPATRDTEDRPLIGGSLEGDVLTGLGAGTYEIVVESETLLAKPASFRAVPGDTVHVEIDVERR